jgi:hypothetical protein
VIGAQYASGKRKTRAANNDTTAANAVRAEYTTTSMTRSRTCLLSVLVMLAPFLGMAFHKYQMSVLTSTNLGAHEREVTMVLTNL